MWAVAAARRSAEALAEAPLGYPAHDNGTPGAGMHGTVPETETAELPRFASARSQAGPGFLRARTAFQAAADITGLGAFAETYNPRDGALTGRARSQGPTGPLAGHPVAIKDVFDVAGQHVGNGTYGLGYRRARADSVAWARLAAAGAVLVGRTRLPELAWAVRTPGCRNPWAPERDAGGSSGGSAVAVAAGIVPLALGTDTGGSIRIPAALCGVAGLRPTVGVVPYTGVTPLAPTLDTVGPIATTAAECLIAHQILAGSQVQPPSSREPLRVGWPEGLWSDMVEPDVASATMAAADALREAGAVIVPTEVPLATSFAREAAFLIILAESASLWYTHLERQPGALSERTSALLEAGAALQVPDYFQALRAAQAIRAELTTLLADAGLTAFLLPTTPVTAQPLDAASVEVAGRPVPVDAAYARLTALASVTGFPALSVPSGLDSAGLPIGAQIIGPHGSEAALCLLGGIIESSPGGRAVSAARARLAPAAGHLRQGSATAHLEPAHRGGFPPS